MIRGANHMRSTLAARSPLLFGGQQSCRNMATIAQLKSRLTSVISIQKITKAMKMVAASKLRQVERLLEGARSYKETIPSSFWTVAEDAEIQTKKHLVVCVTSDRGLCGGVNSSIVKQAKLICDKEVSDGNTPVIMCIGDKSKAGLQRQYGQYMSFAASELGKSKPVTFEEVAVIAQYIISQDYDKITFIYNKFRSAIAYDTTAEASYSLEILADQKAALNYTFDEDVKDVLANIYEYRLASNLFTMMIEGATSEQSARMAAMDNSSKNAGEMIDKLRIRYNRTRQAKITTELIEIISGATAAEEMDS